MSGSSERRRRRKFTDEFKADAVALVEELLQDRVGRSCVSTVVSFLNTRRTFHILAFSETSPDVTMLPITIAPRSVVVIGSLFNNGGYRSLTN